MENLSSDNVVNTTLGAVALRWVASRACVESPCSARSKSHDVCGVIKVLLVSVWRMIDAKVPANWMSIFVLLSHFAALVIISGHVLYNT